jgi:hypothetical protein
LPLNGRRPTSIVAGPLDDEDRERVEVVVEDRDHLLGPDLLGEAREGPTTTEDDARRS